MSSNDLLSHALDLSRRGQDMTAGRVLRRLVESDNAEAAAHLGWLVEAGDPEEALRLYEKAAHGGSLFGALRYAIELECGDKPDLTNARRWYAIALEGFEKALEAGDMDAAYHLAGMYGFGRGVAEDETKEIDLLRRAAAGGHLSAKSDLGHRLWDKPDRTDAERLEAIAMWREAAMGGLRDAQYHLGVNYATDEDMPIDDRESIRFYQMAANNGCAEALYNIGTLYQEGEGVPADLEYAHALIVEAAERGSYGAQDYLAAAYRHGYHDLPIDEAEADYWESVRRTSLRE